MALPLPRRMAVLRPALACGRGFKGRPRSAIPAPGLKYESEFNNGFAMNLTNAGSIPAAATPVMMLKASRDNASGQVYVPPRAFAADGSLRPAAPVEVAASGVLYSCTTFARECFGIVELDCGSRLLALLVPGTDRIGERVNAREQAADGQPRFGHE